VSEGPQRLRDVLEAVGVRLGFRAPVETGAIWSRWREIVGDVIADHAEPSSLRSGVLRVRTESPTWATEIGYLADQVLERANEVAGRPLVSEVRIWVGPERQTTRGKGRDRAPEKGVATKRPSAGSDDPKVALERARQAWSAASKKGSNPGSSQGGDIRESRR
jgi:hypothetical protein